VSQHPIRGKLDARVHYHALPFSGSLGYFLNVPVLRKLLRDTAPDILNAHYASGYGTTARLVGFHPWVMSAWGSDITDFPGKSFFHGRWIKGNFEAATGVLVTSNFMREVLHKLAPGLKVVDVVPFGVSISDFQLVPGITAHAWEGTESFVIGTVKSLEKVYGVDLLIEAFRLVITHLEKQGDPLSKRLRLRIVGEGSQKKQLVSRTRELGLEDRVVFLGRIEHRDVPLELSKMFVYIALSRQESFGVSILEASAAGRPVVVSDVGGLGEVVLNKRTGLIVAPENPQAACDAIVQLLKDRQMACEFGRNGREFVEKTFDWSESVVRLKGFFDRLL
jgi:glycosyltransferase involved in cell wall biosynthesis